NTLLKNTMYEVLVIDMDRFADEASDIMEICSIVYMPVLDNYIDKIKVQNFLDYLNSSGRERMAEKIVQIKTPEPDIVPKGSSYIDALMYGAMGDMIRDLKEG
ncbi:MAG: hypothetical protein Q4E57_05490, partial [Eubacteriales bacterium]|nr:hypothetical protein [Eubacteriales bacterium]